MKTTFLSQYKTNLQPLCESTLQKLSSSPLLRSLQDVKCTMTNRARLGIQVGRVAVMSHLANVRHLVGDVFLFLGLTGLVLHQFFPETPNDHSWYYTNWFYYLETLGKWFLLLFWSLAVFFYWPKQNKSVYIIFTVLHCAGWLGLIHYSIFVHDNEMYHTFPAWYIALPVLSFGAGFLLSANHLVYLWEHKRKGNHARYVGLTEMKLPHGDKEQMYKSLASEYRQINSKY